MILQQYYWKILQSKFKAKIFSPIITSILRFLDGWYEIDPNIHPVTGKQLSLNFINALSIEKASIYGEDKFQYFWHDEPHYKEYAELIKETLTCDFEFHFYPFDKHECFLRFHNPQYTKNFLTITPTKIFTNSKSTNLTELPIEVQSSRLPYKIIVESIEISMTMSTIYEYVNSGIKFTLERKNIGQLLGGFFVPTAIFALLSLVSFTINPDIVSVSKSNALLV